MNNQNINIEILGDAIGDIRNDLIARADRARNGGEIMSVRKHKFWSLQYAGLAAATLVLVLGTVLMLHFLAPAPVEGGNVAATGDDVTTPAAPTTDTPTDNSTPVHVPVDPTANENINLFLERLEQSGLALQYPVIFQGPMFDFREPWNDIIGYRLDVEINNNEHLAVTDFLTEQLATDFIETGLNGETVFRSGTLVITTARRNPQIIDFLSRYYGEPTVLPCDCDACNPPVQPTGFDERLSSFVRTAAAFEHFTDINNTTDIYLLLALYLNHHENMTCWRLDISGSTNERYHNYGCCCAGTDEMRKISPNGGGGRGVSPANLQAFMRENFNPNFRIDSFDFRSKTQAEWKFDWAYDPNRDLLVLVSAAMCGGPQWYRIDENDNLEIREIDGQYHVYAQRIDGWYGTLGYIDVTHFVVEANARGGFRLLSMQPADDSHTPDWIIAFRNLRARFENEPAFLYSRIHEEYSEPHLCSPDWCDLTAGRTICDVCMQREIPELMTRAFRSEIIANLGWEHLGYDENQGRASAA
jgi:hypothetical protein